MEKYRQSLVTETKKNHRDDNSNTQFRVLGVWTAKHGVPVEPALDLRKTIPRDAGLLRWVAVPG